MRLKSEVTQTFDDLELEQQETRGDASSPMLRRSTSKNYLSLKTYFSHIVVTEVLVTSDCK